MTKRSSPPTADTQSRQQFAVEGHRSVRRVGVDADQRPRTACPATLRRSLADAQPPVVAGASASVPRCRGRVSVGSSPPGRSPRTPALRATGAANNSSPTATTLSVAPHRRRGENRNKPAATHDALSVCKDPGPDCRLDDGAVSGRGRSAARVALLVDERRVPALCVGGHIA